MRRTYESDITVSEAREYRRVWEQATFGYYQDVEEAIRYAKSFLGKPRVYKRDDGSDHKCFVTSVRASIRFINPTETAPHVMVSCDHGYADNSPIQFKGVRKA